MIPKCKYVVDRRRRSTGCRSPCVPFVIVYLNCCKGCEIGRLVSRARPELYCPTNDEGSASDSLPADTKKKLIEATSRPINNGVRGFLPPTTTHDSCPRRVDRPARKPGVALCRNASGSRTRRTCRTR